MFPRNLPSGDEDFSICDVNLQMPGDNIIDLHSIVFCDPAVHLTPRPPLRLGQRTVCSTILITEPPFAMICSTCLPLVVKQPPDGRSEVKLLERTPKLTSSANIIKVIDISKAARNASKNSD